MLGRPLTLGTSPLNVPILRSLDPASTYDLQCQLWGSGRKVTDTGKICRAFWQFYERQNAHSLHDGGRHVSVRTHQDLLAIIKSIQSGYSRSDIRARHRDQVSQTSPAEQDELLDGSIDLAATILTLINFGRIQYGFSGRKPLEWSTGSLQSVLEHQFNGPVELGHSRVKFEKTFMTLNLVRMAGLEIVWTDNLADHLRLTDDDTKVHIFHHASFLEIQRTSELSLLPDGLVEETLSTLALLFPSYDVRTRKWLKKLPSTLGIDDHVIACGHLKTDDRQIERFRFWHDRLVILKQAFDETQPRTLSQWWYDRRNGAVWFGFWNAAAILILTALTLLFGVVQCAESGIQAWASMQTLRQLPSPPQ